MKTKLILIVVSLLVFFCFISCGGKTPVAEPTTPAVPETPAIGEDENRLKYTYDVYSYTGYMGKDTEPVVWICRSVEDLEAFCDYEFYADCTGVYDNAYFEDQMLVAVKLHDATYGTKHEVMGVEIKETDGTSVLTVCVDVNTADGGTAMVGTAWIALSIDRLVNVKTAQDVEIEVTYRSENGEVLS